MRDEFFKNKIERLSDEDLIDLVSKARKDRVSTQIFELAQQEANRRHLDFDLIEHQISVEEKTNKLINNTEDLNHWNWGAFILAPFWALSNKLDKWAILSLLPPINIVAMIYLGRNGNRLAYEKSQLESVNDFLQIQKGWTKWGIGIFWILLILGFLGLFFNN
jgi:hypothetical protein